MLTTCVRAYLADALTPPRWAFVFTVWPSSGRGQFVIYDEDPTAYSLGNHYHFERGEEAL